MLSPYALWKIRLVQSVSDVTFRTLETYRDQVDVELEGYGSYVVKSDMVRSIDDVYEAAEYAELDESTDSYTDDCASPRRRQTRSIEQVEGVSNYYTISNAGNGLPSPINYVCNSIKVFFSSVIISYLGRIFVSKTIAENNGLNYFHEMPGSLQDLKISSAIATTKTNERNIMDEVSPQRISLAIPTIKPNEQISSAIPTIETNEQISSAIPTVETNEQISLAIPTIEINERNSMDEVSSQRITSDVFMKNTDMGNAIENNMVGSKTSQNLPFLPKREASLTIAKELKTSSNFNAKSNCLRKFLLNGQREVRNVRFLESLEINSSLLLADLICRSVTEVKYKSAIHESLLSPHDVVERKISEAIIQDEADLQQKFHLLLSEMGNKEENSWFRKIKSCMKSAFNFFHLKKEEEKEEDFICDIKNLF
ncbi:uncharacterized protein CEXT_422411 [Caerostris extrusa]|uniref:Uncharacterized protein n=1 Tax=Caerostris extrusa TaxID=172846 RepID=A0AAV4U2U6_CAEEX|nr:uncharacterized protein CEXT_422411 [Caerostris extrusa]